MVYVFACFYDELNLVVFHLLSCVRVWWEFHLKASNGNPSLLILFPGLKRIKRRGACAFPNTYTYSLHQQTKKAYAKLHKPLILN